MRSEVKYRVYPFYSDLMYNIKLFKDRIGIGKFGMLQIKTFSNIFFKNQYFLWKI